MKGIRKELLFELLKNSKKSDRELAKILGVSQATVSRMRNRLVAEGWIKEFTIIPNFGKLGYELMAVTVGRFKIPFTPELVERGKKWMSKHHNVIFCSKAQGMGRNAIMISLHNDYTDYDRFVQKASSDWADSIEDHESMLISLRGMIVKPFSLRYLAEQEERNNAHTGIKR